MNFEELPETPEELVEILRGLGLSPDGPPSAEYYTEYHYLNISSLPRWMDFEAHYRAVSYNAQVDEVLRTHRMPDPDPDVRIDHVLYGYVFAYGENGWGGDAPLSGSDAADTLRGGQGEDFLYGGDGRDFLYGDEGNDVVDGGRGNDSIFGGIGTDVLYGGLGDDTIRGGEGDDDIGGGFGDDLIYGGDGNDYLYGDAGSDTIYGGNGDDRLRGGDSSSGVRSDILFGGDGNDVITAGSGKNTIYGGKGDDKLGGAGTFYFQKGDGRDVMAGDGLGEVQWISFEEDPSVVSFDDLGIEKLDGDVHPRANDQGGWRVWYSENDYIDLIYAKSPSAPKAPTADDFLFASGGAPSVEPPVSEFPVAESQEGHTQPVDTDGGEGEDAPKPATVRGTMAAETLSGAEGADKIICQNGDDIAHGRDGDDRLWGGGGADVLHGNAHNDRLYGGKGNDSLYGGAGRDWLEGGKGNDYLHGGKAADTLYGGPGNDRLEGRKGDDLLYGGAGADRFVYGDGLIGRDRIGDFEDGKDRLDFTASGLQWSDVSVSSNRDGDAVVRVKGAESRIVLEGVDASLIGQDDFLFS